MRVFLLPTRVLQACVVLLLLLAAARTGHARDYQSMIYQTAQGLPTNLSKGAVEDEQGFLWIATDAGIIRYDGRQFISYENGLASSYPKGFLKTSDGDILIYHDDGISRIAGHNSEELELETVLPGAGNPAPAAVNYPKALYEDQQGYIWISEVYSVARYTMETGELQRYFLPDKYRTSSFVRSFEFHETPAQTLILSSQQGYVFYLDEQQQKFIPIENAPDMGTINTIELEPDSGALWLGTATGIMALHESPPSAEDEAPEFRFEQISERTGISNIARDAQGNIWAGGWNTRETGVLIFSRSEAGQWQASALENFSLNSVNDIYASEEGHTWIVTDEGLALYYRSFFTRIPVEQQRKYVQSLTKRPATGTTEEVVYYMTDASRVYEITADPNGNFSSRVRFENPEMDDLLSVSASEEGLWTTSSRGKIYFMEHDSAPGEYSIRTVETEDNSIFHSLSDSLNRLWYISYNDQSIKRMTPDGLLRVYRERLGISYPVSVLRKAGEHIYAASSDRLHLLRYDTGNDRFVPLPYAESAGGISAAEAMEYNVNDMRVLASGDVLLATSKGLVYYDATAGTYRRRKLNSYLDQQYLKSLLLTENERFIWIGTDTGLYVVEQASGHVSRFDEENGGLPSLTLANRGLSVDSEGYIWAATSAGMARSAGRLELPQSKTPVLVSSLINNVPAAPGEKLEVNASAILQLNVASLMYPADGMRYQVRHGEDAPWQDMEGSGILTLSELPLGNRELHIRALQNGAFRWSSPLLISYRVLPPWYFQTHFILLYIGMIALLTAGVARLYTIRLRKSKAELERIVRLRLQEIKQKNEALIKAKEEADKANRAKSEFLANMSHEIRTPLNGVIGFIDILRASGLSRQQEEYTNYAASSASTLMQLINQVLDLSKVEAGRLELDPQPATLDVLCDTTVNIIRVAAAKKKLPVFLYTDPRLPYRVEADELRLRQVLINLLGNAVKFTESGYVELAVKLLDERPPHENEPHPEGSGDASVPRRMLRFEVIDTGIGIPADKLSRIFNPFSQVDPTTTRKYGGTGLGLSISKSIIDKMGGELHVQSKEGKGSRFYFDVPLPVLKSASGNLPEILTQQNHSALIVSSSRRHARILAGYLEQLSVSPADIIAFDRLYSLGRPPAADIIILDGAGQPDSQRFGRQLRYLLETYNSSHAILAITDAEHPLASEASWPARVRLLQMPVRFRTLRSSLKQVLRQISTEDSEEEQASSSSAAHASGAAMPAPDAPALLPSAILLVDDNPINLKLAEALLKRCISSEITIHTAENGQEAVQRFQEQAYALLLMDIQMPVMDGFTATRRIRELEQKKNRGTPAARVPIVALTAGVSQSEQSKCFDAGMDDFISKPISFDKFKTIISKWIPGTKTSISARPEL